ncbi:hypothetical protein F2Q69_00006141 [Brassica cretica]|uniref:Uncharacterized protein n=1 Tax=Brassica cretica TaxID=69181 RepID=A0A8S9PHV2_BRACR|nr:hypothetical protein F2Q69_00006141 [Brassica cretica]
MVAVELTVSREGTRPVREDCYPFDTQIYPGDELFLTSTWFPASRIIPWVRSGSRPASPGRVCPEPEGLVPVS